MKRRGLYIGFLLMFLSGMISAQTDNQRLQPALNESTTDSLLIQKTDSIKNASSKRLTDSLLIQKTDSIKNVSSKSLTDSLPIQKTDSIKNVSSQNLTDSLPIQRTDSIENVSSRNLANSRSGQRNKSLKNLTDDLSDDQKTDSVEMAGSRTVVYRLTGFGERYIAPMDTQRLNFANSVMMDGRGLAVGYLANIGAPAQSRIFSER